MPINGLSHRLHLFWQYSITLLIGALIALHVMQPVQADEEAHGNRFIVLCYHDVQDELPDHAPRYTIKTSDLLMQLLWLREHGYQAVSLQQILDAQLGKNSLPDKAVLLTFDDGYKSFYTKVFPILKLFNDPAVLSLVGSWMEKDTTGRITTGDEHNAQDYQRSNLMSWTDVREVAASPLVEIASHSFDLHHGILANPQGNMQPAATTHFYEPAIGQYESDAHYLERIRLDLMKNSSLIKQHIGKAPRAMVWPYGAYNAVVSEIAKTSGMSISFNLNDGVNTVSSHAANYDRILMLQDMNMSDFINSLSGKLFRPARIVQIDLDYVYDPDPQQQERNLSMLLDRIKQLDISAVYLQAFSDTDGDNAAETLYFPNRHMPMRADLFNRVAWQLRTRSGVRVYAWLPVFAFHLPRENPAAADVVQSASEKSDRPQFRLSPFSGRVRQTIAEIYEDLAKNAPVAGILFHDDALLSDYEDASPAALSYYQNTWYLPASITEIRQDPALMEKWTASKIEFIDQFTNDLTAVFRKWQPAIKTARNIYARVILDPDSESWFAQSFPRFLENYDYTAIMAMPYMEDAQNPSEWLQNLVAKVKEIPGALEKTIFELQSKNWKTGEPVPSQELAEQIRLVHSLGARNFGYYPDDFIRNQPEFDIIFPVFSLRAAP